MNDHDVKIPYDRELPILAELEHSLRRAVAARFAATAGRRALDARAADGITARPTARPATSRRRSGSAPGC
jgi:hypothetical protein